MKKLLLSIFIIGTFTFYVVYQKFSHSEEINNALPSGVPPQPSSTLTLAVNQSFKDGQYTGDVVDAYYGNVQVGATIAGGRITDITFLQYPSDRRTSVMINTQAMPYLKQEAITAQSANVDIVSGATATSQAFRQSLQSALAQAK